MKEWIPCSSGNMPESFERVLITINDTVTDIATYYGRKGLLFSYEWNGKGFYKHDGETGHYKVNRVTAWMPLPTPYKAGEADA